MKSLSNKKIVTELTVTIIKTGSFVTLPQTFKRRSTTTKPRLVSYTINGYPVGANLNQFIDKTKLLHLINNFYVDNAQSFIDAIGLCFPQQVEKESQTQKKFDSKYQILDFSKEFGVKILLRVSNHNINANNIQKDIDEAYSIVFKQRKSKNTFIDNQNIIIKEYVYFIDNCNREKYKKIAQNIYNLLETSEWDENYVKADVTNPVELNLQGVETNELENLLFPKTKELENIYKKINNSNDLNVNILNELKCYIYDTRRNFSRISRTLRISDTEFITAYVLRRETCRLGKSGFEVAFGSYEWNRRNNEQQKDIYKLANLLGIWFNNQNDFIKKYQLVLSKKQGTETKIYCDNDNKVVYKFLGLNSNCNFLYDCLIERIIIHNYLFGDKTPLRIVGFCQSSKSIYFILKQPLINNATFSTENQINKFLNSFKDFKIHNKHALINNDLFIYDLHSKNVLVKNNDFYVVDCYAKFYRKNDIQNNFIQNLGMSNLIQFSEIKDITFFKNNPRYKEIKKYYEKIYSLYTYKKNNNSFLRIFTDEKDLYICDKHCILKIKNIVSNSEKYKLFSNTRDLKYQEEIYDFFELEKYSKGIRILQLELKEFFEKYKCFSKKYNPINYKVKIGDFFYDPNLLELLKIFKTEDEYFDMFINSYKENCVACLKNSEIEFAFVSELITPYIKKNINSLLISYPDGKIYNKDDRYFNDLINYLIDDVNNNNFDITKDIIPEYIIKANNENKILADQWELLNFERIQEVEAGEIITFQKNKDILDLSEFVDNSDMVFDKEYLCIIYKNGYALANNGGFIVFVKDQYKKEREDMVYNIAGFKISNHICTGYYKIIEEVKNDKINIPLFDLVNILKLKDYKVIKIFNFYFVKEFLIKALNTCLKYFKKPECYIIPKNTYTSSYFMYITDNNNVHNFMLAPANMSRFEPEEIYEIKLISNKSYIAYFKNLVSTLKNINSNKKILTT